MAEIENKITEKKKVEGIIMSIQEVSEHEELALLKYLLKKYLGDKNNVIISCNELLVVGEIKSIEIPMSYNEELFVEMELSECKVFNEKVQ